MKKIFVLLLLLATSIATFAQMSHNFFGATLGVSTKQQAINAFLAKKMNIISNQDNSILVDNVTFDGTTFDHMMAIFYKGKFSKIYFYDEGGVSISKVNSLADKYTRKYPSYRYYFSGQQTNGYILDDDVMNITITTTALIFQDMKIEEQSFVDNEKLYREAHPYTQPRISSTILGCTFGVSSKQQVINALTSRKMKILVNNDPNSVIFTGTTHEGVSFGAVCANFFQGKLVTLLFMHNNQKLSRSQINTLERNLNSKYSAYDYRQRTNNQASSETISYCDDKMFISLSASALAYTDWYLSRKQSRSNTRALRGKTNF